MTTSFTNGHRSAFLECFDDWISVSERGGRSEAAALYRRLRDTLPNVGNTDWNDLEAAYKVAGQTVSVRIESAQLNAVGVTYSPPGARDFVRDLTEKLEAEARFIEDGSAVDADTVGVGFIDEEEDRNPRGVYRDIERS